MSVMHPIPIPKPQRLDVIKVMEELGITGEDERPVVEVLNKVDLLDADERAAAEALSQLSIERGDTSIDHPLRMPISAVTGEGVPALCDLVDKLITADRETVTIDLGYNTGAARAWLHERGDVVEELENGEGSHVTVRLSEKVRGQFFKMFPDAKAVEETSANSARYV